MTTAAVTQLDRPVYGMGQVDQLLRLKSGTARRWIDGYERGGKSYRPVVRPVRTNDGLVTWGEFVECGFLAQYRSAGVPLVNLRPVVDRLRDELGVPYPLAHRQLFVSGRDLVERVQNETQLDRELAIVVRTGQVVGVTEGLEPLALSTSAQRFVDSAHWEGPASDQFIVRLEAPESGGNVVFDPNRSFGSPTVAGIRTDVIAEEVAAGSAVESVAEGFGIAPDLVRAAVAFERAA